MTFQFFQEKIESATDVLKSILKPVIDEEEEIHWPPRDPEALILMQKVCFCAFDLKKIVNLVLYFMRCSCYSCCRLVVLLLTASPFPTI